MQWLNETVNGGDRFRDLTIVQFDRDGSTLSETLLTQAFLRDFRVSDFDAASDLPGSLDFVVVPRSIGSGGDPAGPSAPGFSRNRFEFSLGSIDPSHIAAVRGLHMTVPKIPGPVSASGRREFVPGTPTFDDIVVEMAAPTQAVVDFQAWVNQVKSGEGQTRTGSITAFDQRRDPIGAIELFDVLPAAFPPFLSGPNRRTITLHVGRFELSQ